MCFRIHSFLMSCEISLSFMVYMYIITCKSVHGIKPLQCRECVVAQSRSQRSLLPVPKERERENLGTRLVVALSVSFTIRNRGATPVFTVLTQIDQFFYK